MNRRGWMIGLVLGGTLLTATAEAFTSLPLSVNEMVRRAEKIFVGTCTGVEESVNEYGLSVLTVTFTVQEDLKGEVGRTVTFRQLNPIQPPPPHPGVGGLRLAISTFGLPSYNRGEEAVLFLARAGKIGLTAPLGLAQGKMPVSAVTTGEKQVTNTALKTESALHSTIPASGTAGEYAQFVTAIRALVQAGK